MTCRQLVDQCDALNARTGRRFSIKGQNHAVCLMDESNSPYTPWTSSNKTLSQWMEFMRRGYEIGKAQPVPEVGLYAELSKRLTKIRQLAVNLTSEFTRFDQHDIAKKLEKLCRGN